MGYEIACLTPSVPTDCQLHHVLTQYHWWAAAAGRARTLEQCWPDLQTPRSLSGTRPGRSGAPSGQPGTPICSHPPSFLENTYQNSERQNRQICLTEAQSCWIRLLHFIPTDKIHISLILCFLPFIFFTDSLYPSNIIRNKMSNPGISV